MTVARRKMLRDFILYSESNKSIHEYMLVHAYNDSLRTLSEKSEINNKKVGENQSKVVVHLFT